MQWIFMLVGLAMGAAAGESITGALLGGLLGLGLGQAIRLHGLSAENAALQKQLREFAARFDVGTQAIHERLLKVERSGVQPAAPAAPPTEAPVPVPEAPVVHAQAAAPEKPEQPVDDSELVWELPAELEPEPLVVSPPPRQPDVSDWTLEPLPEPLAEPLPPRQPEPRVARAPVTPPPPPPPREPSLFERGFEAARNWLFGGNTVLRVGVLLLFLGLAFLLRYATEGMVVPIEVRYAGVAAAAIALLGLGWWLRKRNPNYGLMLQGAGIAVLYLTVFAAMRLHPLLDPKMALILLIVVTLCSAILAVLQDALGLAAAAALGGFAAPILTSTGSGNHVALFSYFALLNAGIFAIAWFKAWRLLNLIGFVGTFGIGFAWGLRSYKPELFASTEPFLVLFFLMYLAIGLLFARRKLREAAAAPDGERDALLRWSARQGDYIDGTVLFGPPLVGFGLQYAVIHHIEFGAAFSALAMGLLYMFIARVLAGRAPGRALLLVETCMALGVVFGTLAIPLGLDARWTSAAWAVEGAGIFWLGLRQRRPLARAFALLLQVGAALAFLGSLRLGVDSLLDGAALGALMLGVALLFSFWQLRGAQEEEASAWERSGLPVLACSGLAFLYLIAPLCLRAEGTAIVWALAGLATLYVGLRLASRTFLFSAFAVQLLGGAVFLLGMDRSGLGSGSALGWSGLVTASLIGLALIGGMLVAARDDMVRNDKRLLHSMSLVLLVGLVFINLAVLFVLPWRTASAVWGGSGLLIVWLSLHLQLRASFVFGLALQVIAGLSFLAVSPLLLGQLSAEGLRPLAHAGFWTPLVLSLAALAGAWRLHHETRREDPRLQGLSLGHLSQLLLVWSAGWWTLTWVAEIARFAAPELQVPLVLLAAAVTVALWMLLALRTQWRTLALLCLLLVPGALVVLMLAWNPHYHPAADFGWLGWGALFAVHLLALRKLHGLLPEGPRSAAHVLGCWLILGVLALELRYLLMLLSEHYNAWRWLGWALLPSLYLLLVTRVSRLPWPVVAFPREYRLWAAMPLAAMMLAWFWIANAWSDGSADPLPYLPLVNPLELGLLFALLGVWLWLRENLGEFGFDASIQRLAPQLVVGASLFALATAIVFRSAHHWGGVPFVLDAQLDSMLVQAGLSIVWTSIALGLMIGGHRRVHRELWLVGAALIAVVVAKLFFVELGNRGGLERIISFIGVGVLLLVVGYFAPLPPKRAAPESEQVNA
ncbi:putative membrane protein [Pseudomonas alcaligenes]|nr:putative membrane protein [Pseudomonas alcaligenes]